MSLNFYTEEEDNKREESINNYKFLFVDYEKKLPTLDESLYKMFRSANLCDAKITELINDIIDKCKKTIDDTYIEIQKKYNNITQNDGYIICAYTCESKDKRYSPYKILNQNLVSNNRKKGIENISKYLYIFLKSLRKLPRYYPTNKYLYRCITHKVSLSKDPFNENLVPYIIGNKKTFWGFTSTSSNPKMTYNFLKDGEIMKAGTVFSLGGDIWGYDIELFNFFREKEILLEPERKFNIDNVLPPLNEIINVTCTILKTPLVLLNIEKEKEINEIFQSDEFNNLSPIEFQYKYKNHSHIKVLMLLKNIHKELLEKYKFSNYMLDPRGNKINNWSTLQQRGNKNYDPPIGFIGFGLRVLSRFDNEDNIWIGKSNNKNEWCVAYHAIGEGPIMNLVNRIIQDRYKLGPDQEHKKCDDIFHPGKKVGEGIYCSPYIKVAEDFSGEVTLADKMFKVVLMNRVKTNQIRACNCDNGNFWVVDGTPDEIRPYRILFKMIN